MQPTRKPSEARRMRFAWGLGMALAIMAFGLALFAVFMFALVIIAGVVGGA